MPAIIKAGEPIKINKFKHKFFLFFISVSFSDMLQFVMKTKNISLFDVLGGITGTRYEACLGAKPNGQISSTL